MPEPLTSTLYIGEAFRRLGVKGAEAGLRMVPGFFPTVQFANVSDLVPVPVEARGVAYAARLLAGAAQPVKCSVFAPTEMFIEWIRASSTTAGCSLGIAKRAVTYANPMGQMDIGGEPTRATATQQNGGIISDVQLDGRYVIELTDLRWRLGAGDGIDCDFYCSAVGPSSLKILVGWKELPAPAGAV